MAGLLKSQRLVLKYLEQGFELKAKLTTKLDENTGKMLVLHVGEYRWERKLAGVSRVTSETTVDVLRKMKLVQHKDTPTKRTVLITELGKKVLAMLT